MHKLQEIVLNQKNGISTGIYSICSANKYVIKAALLQGLEDNSYVLIESTANQVNQFGGYTGMTPKDFKHYVEKLAEECKFPKDKLILGGDHLGPLTWSKLCENEAMENAKDLVKAYVEAGFTKIHIDTSMKVGDDPEGVLFLNKVAERAADLVRVCEDVNREQKPIYIVGSEVPIPGGATDEHESIQVTTVCDFEDSVSAFMKSFKEKNLEEAWDRVIGFVVQPGVEFGNHDVILYDRNKAKDLIAALKKHKGLVFEGHSTDYQTAQSLTEMVEDGIAILKVGPGLTFAFRESIFALEAMERELITNNTISNLSNVIEEVMLRKPIHWIKHYSGNENELKIQRRYSYSDRIRYYLNEPEVDMSIEILFNNLETLSNDIPLSIVSQYMPEIYTKIRNNKLGMNPHEWVIDHIRNAIKPYSIACNLKY